MPDCYNSLASAFVYFLIIGRKFEKWREKQSGNMVEMFCKSADTNGVFEVEVMRDLIHYFN